MKCTKVELGAGKFALVCGRRAQRNAVTCAYCKRPSTKLCDGRRERGTCDRAGRNGLLQGLLAEQGRATAAAGRTVVNKHDLIRGHSLMRPASPGQIIAKALSDAGKSKKWLRKQCFLGKRLARDVLNDSYPVWLGLAIVIGGALGRNDLRLMSAQRACALWDAEERRINKELGL